MRFLGARAAGLNLLGTRVLGHDDEDVGEVHFVAAQRPARRAREQRVDLVFGNDDLVVDLALAQAGHDDLGADIFAELRERHAVSFERLPQLGHRDLVLLGYPRDGPIELHVIDAQPRFSGELKLHAVGDEALEQLTFDDGPRRRFGSLLRKLLHRELSSLLELARGDRFVVDHGDDAVDHDGPARSLRGLRGESRKDGERRCEDEGALQSPDDTYRFHAD